MKSTGMPFAMWLLFEKSFKQNLTAVFGMTEADAKSTMAKAKKKYKETIGNLPEFEKGDRFRLNIVGCAMLAAAVLSMPERPEVETLTVYYRKSMMTAPMKWFCRMSGKKKFTPKDMDGMKFLPPLFGRLTATHTHGIWTSYPMLMTAATKHDSPNAVSAH